MARLPRLPRGSGPRRLPWQVIFTVGLRVAREGRRRWDRLAPREQRELTRILRKSRGRSGELTPAERTELRRLVWKAAGAERR